MNKARASERGRLFPATDRQPIEGAELLAAIRLDEVTIEGRRYRLVPVPEVHVPPGDPVSAAPDLTAREEQIARLVAEGLVNKQIASELRISEWTVATHLRRIFAKLGVDTRAAMVSRCFSRAGSRPSSGQ